jgi:hypothetical protein
MNQTVCNDVTSREPMPAAMATLRSAVISSATVRQRLRVTPGETGADCLAGGTRTPNSCGRAQVAGVQSR